MRSAFRRSSWQGSSVMIRCLFLVLLSGVVQLTEGAVLAKEAVWQEQSMLPENSPGAKPGVEVMNMEAPPKNSSSPKIMCYFSLNRQPYSSPLPPEMNITLCTHILFLGSYARDGVVVPANPKDIELYYEKVTLMKKMNPSLKVILSNGCDFGPLLATDKNRTRFAQSTVPLLRKYGFDGFDLDWEFPAWGQYRGLPRQKQNFTLIMQTFREVYEQEAKASGHPRLTISAAVGSTSPLLNACYDIAGLAKYVDFINLMTYDIHGFSNVTPFTGFNSPLHSGKTLLDLTIFLHYNLAWSANEWVRRGLQPQQLMVGVPTYAHTFDLMYRNFTVLYAPACSADKKLGDEINYPAVCTLLANQSTTMVWDDDCMVPYLYNERLWVSFDNIKSVTLKTKFIVSGGFGGVMTYSLNSDDFEGKCDGTTKWPLHLAIHRAAQQAVQQDTKPGLDQIDHQNIQ